MSIGFLTYNDNNNRCHCLKFMKTLTKFVNRKSNSILIRFITKAMNVIYSCATEVRMSANVRRSLVNEKYSAEETNVVIRLRYTCVKRAYYN